jgi:hypothetical protein
VRSIQNLVRISKGMGSVQRRRHGCGDNIKMDLNFFNLD